jgi:hypothetical protein
MCPTSKSTPPPSTRPPWLPSSSTAASRCAGPIRRWYLPPIKGIAAVRDGFAAKKLGLTAEAADSGINVTAEKMKAASRKSRVTFYYLLAGATGTLGKLSS